MVIALCSLCSLLTVINTAIVFHVIAKYRALQKKYIDLYSKYDDLNAELGATEFNLIITRNERDYYRKKLEDYEHYII